MLGGHKGDDIAGGSEIERSIELPLQTGEVALALIENCRMPGVDRHRIRPSERLSGVARHIPSAPSLLKRSAVIRDVLRATECRRAVGARVGRRNQKTRNIQRTWTEMTVETFGGPAQETWMFRFTNVQGIELDALFVVKSDELQHLAVLHR